MMNVLNFCYESKDVWQLVGKILLVFKIVIPLLLIIFGMIDLGQAVIGSKEDDIKKATNKLLRRAIAAVVIFFIPTIVGALMGLVGSFKDDKTASGYDICKDCLTKPYSKKCKDAKDTDPDKQTYSDDDTTTKTN